MNRDDLVDEQNRGYDEYWDGLIALILVDVVKNLQYHLDLFLKNYYLIIRLFYIQYVQRLYLIFKY